MSTKTITETSTKTSTKTSTETSRQAVDQRVRPGGPRPHPRPHLWLRRLGWMLALWAGGVGTLYLTASLIRAIMHAAGMR